MGALTNAIPNPLYSALFNVIAVGLQQVIPQSLEEYPSFGDCWNKDDSTFALYKDPALTEKYRMTPVKRLGVTRFWMEGEVYNSQGYAGQERRAVDSYDAREAWIGHFELQEDPVPPFPGP